VEGKYNTKETWRDKDGKELHPHTNYYVGGNTKFYGAALFRLREVDFGEIRHHGGISPAWPISYDDLEPYYSQAERLYQFTARPGKIRPSRGAAIGIRSPLSAMNGGSST
jgi:choline dehydrogenase-like flavoprotein